MEEEVKQDTSETETQEKRNTEECEETAEASAENTETPEDGEASEEKDKKGFFSGRKKEKKEDAVKAQINELQDKVMRQMAEWDELTCFPAKLDRFQLRDVIRANARVYSFCQILVISLISVVHPVSFPTQKYPAF